MIYVVSNLVFFILFAVSHVILYRLKWIRLQSFVLLFIGVFWLSVYLLIIFFIPVFNSIDKHNVAGFPLIVTSIILYGLLCLGYAAECSVVQYESPSIIIIDLISRCPDGKLPYTDLKAAFSNEKLVLSRLNDLTAQHYIALKNSRYVFCSKSGVITKVIRNYRKLICRELGG